MRKFMIYPLFNILSLEKKLEQLEKEGWMLEYVKCSCLFHFKKRPPKRATYCVTIKSFRGPSMSTLSQGLKSDHAAMPIDGKWCYYELYRSLREKDEFAFLKECQLSFIDYYLKENLLCSFLVAIPGALCFFMGIISAVLWHKIVAIVVFSIILLDVIYRILSIFLFKRKWVAQNNKDST